MKSIEELKALRDKARSNMGIRESGYDSVRVVVGMATCGIAAGARPVLAAISQEVANEKLTDVVVSQTGCIGLCQYEPIVEVFDHDKEKVTYIKVDEAKAKEIVQKHLKGGNVIKEYTIANSNLS